MLVSCKYSSYEEEFKGMNVIDVVSCLRACAFKEKEVGIAAGHLICYHFSAGRIDVVVEESRFSPSKVHDIGIFCVVKSSPDFADKWLKYPVNGTMPQGNRGEKYNIACSIETGIDYVTLREIISHVQLQRLLKPRFSFSDHLHWLSTYAKHADATR